MKIVLCGSLKFANEMRKLEAELAKKGHHVLLPIEMQNTNYQKKTSEEGIRNIISHDLIRTHYKKILDADAILVVNHDSKGIKNYIGGNTFLEMGFAHVNGKKVFVLNSLPTELNYYEELAGMQPVVLNGDLSKVQ